MSEPISPSIGWGVLHLFCRATSVLNRAAVVSGVNAAQASGHQVVCASMLGHKADVAVMAVASDLRDLKALQTVVQHAGLSVVDSYVSLTEVSEYAQGVPEAMRQARLYPNLPPEGKPAFCFYPMSKRRNVGANWFTLPYEERLRQMQEHGHSGRKFGAKVTQLVTGSTGLDDYEWGVTLFAVNPDDLKEVVYTMRFDRASAIYGEFGPFYTGMVVPVEEIAATL